jgi:hypothetical protein
MSEYRVPIDLFLDDHGNPRIVPEPEREQYRARVAAGGCHHARCTDRGCPEYAVWWKCLSGHLEELRYCAEHGPHHLVLAVSGPLCVCECGAPMRPVVEGLDRRGSWTSGS